MNERLVLMDWSQAMVVLAGGCVACHAKAPADLPVKRIDRHRLPVTVRHYGAERAWAVLRLAGA